MYGININMKRKWVLNEENEQWLCVFIQTWFWISMSCQVLWVRMPGRGSARPCWNSTTTKTTRSWPIAYLLYAHLLILARSSQNLTPWTRMVRRLCSLNTCPHTSPQSFIHSKVFQGEYWYILDFIPCDHKTFYMFFASMSIWQKSVCPSDFYCCLIFHFLLLFVFLCVCVRSVFLSAVLCMYVIHLTSKYPLLSTHETSQA